MVIYMLMFFLILSPIGKQFNELYTKNNPAKLISGENKGLELEKKIE